MTHIKTITKSTTEKHLSFKERIQIQTLKTEGHLNREISRRLGRAPQTINNEIKHGTVTQKSRQKQHGKTYVY